MAHAGPQHGPLSACSAQALLLRGTLRDVQVEGAVGHFPGVVRHVGNGGGQGSCCGHHSPLPSVFPIGVEREMSKMFIGIFDQPNCRIWGGENVDFSKKR